MENGGKQNAFIGRTREISELRGLLKIQSRVRRTVCPISGQTEVGKTRLADELAADAASRGARVAWGRCWEGGGAPAYWPSVEIVRSLVLARPARRKQQTAHPLEIAQLIPGAGGGNGPGAGTSNPEQGRFRLFERSRPCSSRSRVRSR